MKRSISAIAFLLAAAMLAGCSSSTTPTETTKTAETEQAAGPESAEESDAEVKTDYPKGTITIINTSSAGSASDLIARTIAQSVSESLGVPVVVDDKPGGSGAVGCTEVANSAADGYTLLLSVYGHTLLTPSLSDVGYGNESFSHICMLGTAPFTFCVKPDKFASMTDMEAAFKNGDELTVGVPGATSGPAIYLKMLKEELKVGENVQAIPYDSGAEAVAALMGGDIDIVCAPASETMKYHESGELKVLLICNNIPYTGAEDIPTADKQGYSTVGELWYGISAPTGTEDSVIACLEEQFKTSWEKPEISEAISNIGAIPKWMGHEEFSSYCAEQYAQLQELK
ncbi:MAG: tripartite tricarboxylate transporter substrate binding protein [Clostridium sp.]|nr:tripartite tricarboxylate transporter substrate binding protein [Clostridium sp.]